MRLRILYKRREIQISFLPMFYLFVATLMDTQEDQKDDYSGKKNPTP